MPPKLLIASQAARTPLHLQRQFKQPHSRLILFGQSSSPDIYLQTLVQQSWRGEMRIAFASHRHKLVLANPIPHMPILLPVFLHRH